MSLVKSFRMNVFIANRMTRAGEHGVGAVVFFALLSVSCRSHGTATPAPVSDGGEPVASAEPEAAAPAPAAPPHLDAKALERQLGCPSRRHAHACYVAHQFAQSTHSVTQVPSGEGRWVGHAYRVERGAERGELEVLSVTNVPTNPASPTDLPFKIAMGTVPKDKRRDGQKLARALAHGDTVSGANKALPFVKAWSSDNGRVAMSTAGVSVRLLAEEATFLRQGPGQRLFLIRQRLAAPGAAAAAGDGTYAELWPVKW
jgi:hypothetical protein